MTRRIAVVGGAGGIGRALVARLLREGAQVAVLDLPASLERHPVPEGVAAIAVDLTIAASVTTAAAALGALFPALEGCVNLAGFGSPTRRAVDVPEAEFDEVMAGNLGGPYRWAKAVMPLLHAAEGASLVHTASGLGQYIRPGFGAYAMAKAGLIALTKTLALEHAPSVRVNAVGPAAVDTAFLRGGTGRSNEQAEPQLDLDAYSRMIPLRRLAVAEDVVGPILFLLGADSRYMTGQVLWINGGMYMP